MKDKAPEIGSSTIPSPMVFTDSAADKVCELIKEEKNPNLNLRVFISGGGCFCLVSQTKT